MRSLVVMGIFILALGGCKIINSDDKTNLRFSDPAQKPFENQFTGKKPTDDTQYEALRVKLFEASCTKCHNPIRAARSGRLDFTKQNVILENLDDIIYRISDAFDIGIDNMPPEGPQVAPEIIRELKAWKLDRKFLALKKNLFEASCTKCHNPSNSRLINLTSKDVIFERVDDIVYRMAEAFDDNNKPMPPIGKGTRVSAELIKEFEIWRAAQEVMNNENNN